MGEILLFELVIELRNTGNTNLDRQCYNDQNDKIHLAECNDYGRRNTNTKRDWVLHQLMADGITFT